MPSGCGAATWTDMSAGFSGMTGRGLGGALQGTGMNREHLVAWAIVIVSALLLVLAFLVPKTSYLNFRDHPAAEHVLVKNPRGGPEMRAKAAIPVPRRYIETARAEVQRLMAEPGWKALQLEQKQARLMEIFILRAIDAEYWTMPEARQRRMSEAFLQAFLGDDPGSLVDK
jgi:hypothetical protein